MRLSLASLIVFGVVSPAHAHFLFVVPAADGTTAQVILSEDLQPDEDIDDGMIDSSKLWSRKFAGTAVPLTIEKKAEAHQVTLPRSDQAVVYGAFEFGVNQRGDSPPFLLVYHPKTILGNAFATQANLGEAAPAEIIPIGRPGDVRFRIEANGKPVANSEVTVILPNASQTKVKTDSNGETETFAAMGRYGVWARCFETKAGMRDSQNYEQIRHYPTLVVDIGDGTDSVSGTQTKVEHPQLAPMPEAASSFGAVACDGWLYVYGGHIVRTHKYSTAAVSRRFHRFNLADGKTWEELPGGPGLQGMNLAAHAGKIYRVGGMEPRNKPDENEDNHSVADCVCFDPATGKWEPLPPLPVPRSSHDVVVVDGKLYVIGGWNMTGKDGQEWLSKMDVLDLTAKNLAWTSVEQPFQRRALIAAVADRKIYLIGGFMEDDTPSLDVDIYDASTGKWSSGPNIPGPQFNGFAPAACALNGRVFVSVGNGNIYCFNQTAGRWDRVAANTPRIVHRIVPYGSKILVMGGAAKGDNFDLIEVVDVGQEM
ncbi:MAG: hypothetical protein IT427_11895 [Pirellulales bacterium]|nr:hypothetical protein [Pirellulales bacterium]